MVLTLQILKKNCEKSITITDIFSAASACVWTLLDHNVRSLCAFDVFSSRR